MYYMVYFILALLFVSLFFSLFSSTVFLAILFQFFCIPLLFPAISLLLLAYTNRFFSLAALIRSLSAEGKPVHSGQLKNLRRRIVIIRRMQEAGVSSFALCVLCMIFIYVGFNKTGSVIFGSSLLLLLYSLLLSVLEIRISVDALNYHLQELDQ